MNVAKYIDHTNLKAYTSKEDIIKLCEEAKKYNFYAVCVNPYRVKLAKEHLKGTDIKVASVIGFPLGATPTEVKVFEANKALEDGADELDMVINIGALKDKDYEYVKKDIEDVTKVAHEKGAIVKVIIETCYLTEEEKEIACKLAMEARADFVKTSTGFGTGGATIEDVKLMRRVVGDKLGVKAAGGIRTYEDALAMINAGANRIGTSSGVKIIEGAKNE
ncbi:MULTISPECIES: deoxyribose-phosphate aldolase [Thermococcus]|uniref:Deoxyribose-phosphate aldolase n=2 Tax=Thermococcus sibiricus TaxID=172049 RepID=C6A3K7_THESM|nr:MULTISPECIES: deoxyribose-phosphate aldolase [Thermococcus]KUK29215.1 MAG: Deoxyribose-phosphate aldolase [Thermococcus sp. 40_45]HII68097.1 deoxyribose-phosphate aldolase [Thermococcaceae archaeon]ACS90202.1 Probable deoxyribose-phosphate aldolase [Thermococcus sibiricus MM 739]KUK18173.1 MAG: Deoxyribose-phosphate aldolase [Thermococcus sibiricus]MBC7095237.1 deoxyribose-phosphate aldolase [Thermococcus sp.]